MLLWLCHVGASHARRAQDFYATTALAFVHKAHAAVNIFQSNMNCQTQIDRQRLFLEYRKIFVDRNACVRKRRVVRKLVSDQQPVPDDSVGDGHIDQIIPSLISLPKCRVFESEEEARKHFPDLFSEPLQEPTANDISKKRKASSGRAVEEKCMLQAECIEKPTGGTAAGKIVASLLFNTKRLT